MSTITKSERLLTRAEVADMLGVAPGTLAVWSCTIRESERFQTETE